MTWLGHAAFEVTSAGGTRLLIDPFLTKNPATTEAFKDLARYKVDAILVSHSHADHSGDAADGINLKDFCHVLREIDNDRDVAALAC